MIEQEKVVGDVFRHLATTTDEDLQVTTKHFSYLLDRRDRLVERARFGLLALNAASLAGLVSAADKFQGPNAVVALSKNSLKYAAAFFIFGMMLSVVVLFLDTIKVGADASHSFVRMSKLRNLKGMLNTSLNDKSNHETSEAMSAVHEFPPKDFEYSKLAIALHSSSGAAWIGGILALLLEILTSARWC